MPFVSSLTNQTFTDNGANAYKSTNSAVLDLFSQGVSSQDKDTLIKNALTEDPLLALKAALYLRDVRQGQGNRDILKALFSTLNKHQMNKTMKLIIKHIPEIGRWKDVIELIGLNAELDKKIIKMVKKGLKEKDALLAKWLPRQGNKAKYIALQLDLDHGTYRRKIVKLSSTIEQQMSQNQWAEIAYKSVPSIANKKYNKAFLRNDEARRTQFLEDALSGKTTMKASVLYPHQITSMITTGAWSHKIVNDPTANALWANLPNYMEEASNVLSIIDTSGSMTCKATGTEGSCLDIALGLGLYFAEHNTGAYKNLWMNFSSNPSAQMLKGNTLYEKVNSMDMDNWGGSTDIDKAMDFVLKAAKQNPEDTPKMILIVSDMEFNSCTNQTQTNHDYMKQQFNDLGLELPTIVFWRVNVSSGSQHVTMNEKGTVLINGYSPSVIKHILSGDIADYTPYNAMRQILDPMYTWLEK